MSYYSLKDDVNELKIEKLKKIFSLNVDVSNDLSKLLSNSIMKNKHDIDFYELESLFNLANKINELKIIMSLETELDDVVCTLSESINDADKQIETEI